ncbi:hypothetical protein C1A50_4822 [Paenibacillus polymyxa]|nr:hypothetical protein C1A50_4822 [Paenibacillus polymyxa]
MYCSKGSVSVRPVDVTYTRTSGSAVAGTLRAGAAGTAGIGGTPGRRVTGASLFAAVLGCAGAAVRLPDGKGCTAWRGHAISAGTAMASTSTPAMAAKGSHGRRLPQRGARPDVGRRCGCGPCRLLASYVLPGAVPVSGSIAPTVCIVEVNAVVRRWVLAIGGNAPVVPGCCCISLFFCNEVAIEPELSFASEAWRCSLG